MKLKLPTGLERFEQPIKDLKAKLRETQAKGRISDLQKRSPAEQEKLALIDEDLEDVIREKLRILNLFSHKKERDLQVPFMNEAVNTTLEILKREQLNELTPAVKKELISKAVESLKKKGFKECPDNWESLEAAITGLIDITTWIANISLGYREIDSSKN